jgi:hypothetical protein
MSSRFLLGSLVQTPGVRDSVPPERVLACLRLHVSGEWGELDAHDKRANEAALKHGDRILSAYFIDPAKPELGRIYIITEADRSSTCVLLPEEY